MRSAGSPLLLLVLLDMCLQICDAKVYQRSLSKKTPKCRRTWGGMQSNTGKNFGGWLVQITDNTGHFACGGAYYAPLLVITSANCMYSHMDNMHGAAVEGTAISKCDSDVYSEVDTVYFPDNFIPLKRYMDVAVVRIKQPIKGRLTEFIKLCSIDLTSGMSGMVFGWGHDSELVQKTSTSTQLRSGWVPILGLTLCRRRLGRAVRLSSTSMCVQLPPDPNECLYESGCPLIHKNELCGIVSVGSHCQNTSMPGIYTNIHKVAKFITDTEAAILKGILVRSPTKSPIQDKSKNVLKVPMLDILKNLRVRPMLRNVTTPNPLRKTQKTPASLQKTQKTRVPLKKHQATPAPLRKTQNPPVSAKKMQKPPVIAQKTHKPPVIVQKSHKPPVIGRKTHKPPVTVRKTWKTPPTSPLKTNKTPAPRKTQKPSVLLQTTPETPVTQTTTPLAPKIETGKPDIVPQMHSSRRSALQLFTTTVDPLETIVCEVTKKLKSTTTREITPRSNLLINERR